MLNLVLEFLTALGANNNREWFEENRPKYEQSRKIMLDLTKELLSDLALYDQEAALNKPEKCLFRIYRDVRFSKDKSPYKTHMGIFMAPGGNNAGNAGYYLHIEPQKSFLGAGVYAPAKEALLAVRREIYYNTDTFLSIVQDEAFKNAFGELMDEKLLRPPKDFPADFPHIEWLKYKHYAVGANLTNEAVKSADFVDVVKANFRLASAFNNFLNKALKMDENQTYR